MEQYVYGVTCNGFGGYSRITDVTLFMENQDKFGYCEEQDVGTDKGIILKERLQRLMKEEFVSFNGKDVEIRIDGIELYFQRLYDRCAELMKIVYDGPTIQRFIRQEPFHSSYKELQKILWPPDDLYFYHKGNLMHMSDFAKLCWDFMQVTETTSITLQVKQVFTYREKDKKGEMEK